MPKKRKDQIFNFKRNKLLRKEIPLRELGASLGLLVFVFVMGWWVAVQRDNYDPGERDISMEVLIKDKAEDNLYKMPLQRWADPALAVAVMGGGGAVVADLGPLPPSLLNQGWQAGRVERFSPDNLFEKINGKADKIISYGFKELTVIPFQHPIAGHDLDVLLYDLGEPANANNLFQDEKSGEIQTLGSVSYTPTSVGAVGAAGSYFVQILGTKENEPALIQKTKAVLGALAEIVGDVVVVDPVRQLFEAELACPPDSVGRVNESAFQYGLANRVWFGGPPAGQPEDANWRYFLHQARSAEDASRLVELLHPQLLGQWQPQEPGRYKHKFLAAWFVIRAEGPLVFGVEFVPEAELGPAVEALEAAVAKAGLGADPESPPVAAAAAEAEEGAAEPGDGEEEGPYGAEDESSGEQEKSYGEEEGY